MPVTLRDAPIFGLARRLRADPIFAYVLPIGSFLVALALRFALNPVLPSGFPYLTFFPAVLLTAFFGGWRPGLLCGTLSVLAAWFWFIRDPGSFWLDLPSAVAVLFFVFIVAVDITIIELMTRAMDRLEDETRRSEALRERQETLFQELQHRVANNFSFIAALLSLHRRRAAGRPELAAGFEDAAARLETMSRVHRRLYDPRSIDQPVADYLRALGNDMLETSGRTDIALDVDCAPIALDLDRLQTVSLVVIEVMTNAMKHGFSGRGGRLAITLAAFGEDIELCVADDGPGFPEGFDPTAGDRLGLRILAGFARTLEATIAYENRSGAAVRLRFARVRSRV